MNVENRIVYGAPPSPMYRVSRGRMSARLAIRRGKLIVKNNYDATRPTSFPRIFEMLFERSNRILPRRSLPSGNFSTKYIFRNSRVIDIDAKSGNF